MVNAYERNKVARVSSYEETHDDFPTPPWATRALLKYVIPDAIVKGLKVLEPACGRGHITKVLRQNGIRVAAYDAFDYGDNQIKNYLTDKYSPYDVLLTNPPYKYADEFVLRGLSEASCGVAVLVKSSWLVGQTRYSKLFGPRPPTKIGMFARNMSATRGKVIRKGSNMFSHSWVWWDQLPPTTHTEFVWIPPTAQAELEHDNDYT